MLTVSAPARCMCYSATAKMEINKETPLNPIIQDIKKEKLRYGSWLQWPFGPWIGAALTSLPAVVLQVLPLAKLSQLRRFPSDLGGPRVQGR